MCDHRSILDWGYNIYDAFDSVNPHFQYRAEHLHLFSRTEQYNLIVTREMRNPLHA
jgi:hypothetical protein